MSGARRRFRFIKEIAEGGFGKVYLAEQLSADGFSRIVALKLLHAKWSSHDEIVMRTRDEARLLGLIRHQHIVRVEDLTSIDGKCAIVMEYLEGVDLKAMMGFLRDQGMLFPRAALFEIMIGVAGALDAAYNGRPLQGGDPLNVIHRDIKPSNIFVTVNSAIKVLDFGTARANFAEREAKTQALAFGSQGYMAPERMLGEEDVFSLGISLYECLTSENFGRIPPRPNKFAAKMEERVASIPLEGDADWCEQVRETLRSMMAYEPDDRPSAKQLVESFEVLAQNAEDMAFRRFCRTLVTEAKSVQPEMDTGDPLTGTVISEDRSSTWEVGDDGRPIIEEPEETTLTGGAIPAPPGLEVAQNTGAPSKPPGRSEPQMPENFGELADEELPKKGGAGKLIASVAGLVILGGGALAVIAIILVGGYVSMGSGSTSESVQTNSTVEKSESKPDKPSLKLPDGGKIESPGTSKQRKSKSTKLSLSSADGAVVNISDITGFKAVWDGKGEWDIGPLPAGKYKTNIQPVEGKKHRSRYFEVEARRACTFTFDLKKSAWEGSCK